MANKTSAKTLPSAFFKSIAILFVKIIRETWQLSSFFINGSDSE